MRNCRETLSSSAACTVVNPAFSGMIVTPRPATHLRAKWVPKAGIVGVDPSSNPLAGVAMSHSAT